MSIPPCTVNIGVVSGPDAKLREKNISRQESQRRLHAHESEIKKDVRKNKNKGKEKTPLAVKVAGAVAVLAGIFAFIKMKIKK